ncbi:MAG TPA: hypothetical protein DIW47_01130 [Bacteroidetes bacterium]|nr:hypothetical protein [Bacteroidota bacterium]
MGYGIKIKSFIVVLILMLGCDSPTNPKSDTTIPNDSSISEVGSAKDNKVPQSEYASTDALWGFDSNAFNLIKLRPFRNDTLTVESVEKIINTTWPRVQIRVQKRANDTLFISIPNSEILTQQMGSTGAHIFMVTTTYSFTEIQGIKYVSYAFKVGDHANPGIYSRGSFD